MRVGLSYHGGDGDYQEYPAALHRRAAALGMEIETVWIAGAGREPGFDRLEGLDALVLTGGADVEPQRYGFDDPSGLCTTDPQRDVVEWDILQRLERRPLPMLAICRGAQLLNVFHGGTLIADLGERNAVHQRGAGERREHVVSIAYGSRLREIIGAGSGRVNSSHHQAIDRLAPGFRLAAVSADGVVEAFEPQAPDGRRLLLAVQWHPESMTPGEALGDRTLDALLSEKH